MQYFQEALPSHLSERIRKAANFLAGWAGAGLLIHVRFSPQHTKSAGGLGQAKNSEARIHDVI